MGRSRARRSQTRRVKARERLNWWFRLKMYSPPSPVAAFSFRFSMLLCLVFICVCLDFEIRAVGIEDFVCSPF